MPKPKLSEEDLNQHLLSYLNGVKLEYDKELELSVIGSMLNNPDCASSGTQSLIPEMFSNEMYRCIFKAITELEKEKAPVDIITVFARLKKNSKEISTVELARISSDYHQYPNSFEYRSRILVYQYIKRQYFELLRFASKVFGDTNLDSWIDDFQEEASSLSKALQRFTEPDSSTEEIPIFRKHWLRKGEDYLNVLQSKYDPTKGYAWLNGKSYTEEALISLGYIKDFDGPTDKI